MFKIINQIKKSLLIKIYIKYFRDEKIIFLIYSYLNAIYTINFKEILMQNNRSLHPLQIP